MRGAVAGGHPLTAEAGARVLEAGGNAVDAAVGAALVSWVAESPLTGPGAGGFMLVHRARDRSTRVFDFFVAIPGLGDDSEFAVMEHVDVDFSGGSTQRFHIGAASCAIPGAALGLETAHRAFGRLPWRDLFEPAIELARGGVVLNDGQAYLHRILDLILRHTPEARAVYEQGGGSLGVGDTLVQKDLAGTLELLADKGPDVLYRGELGERIVEHVRASGGCFTHRDLNEYRVIRRRPVRATFCGEEFFSNPPPSRGGVLIASGLPLLQECGVGKPDTAQAIDRPRVHLEGDDLHCEGGHDPAELDKLERMGWNVTRWRKRNLYFGGAAAVTLEGGRLAAAGDPRRGGAGVVVE